MILKYTVAAKVERQNMNGDPVFLFQGSVLSDAPGAEPVQLLLPVDRVDFDAYTVGESIGLMEGPEIG